MNLYFGLINKSLPISAFDCDEPELNVFFKNSAILFQERHFGVTVVCSDTTSGVIIGYYTLCPACIQRSLLPEKLITGPRPNPIPAFRLCRFAIDHRYHGKGYGKILFVHALERCLAQAHQIGGSIIIIDAKHHKAKAFYEHFGFIPLISDPLILIQTIKYIAHHLVR